MIFIKSFIKNIEDSINNFKDKPVESIIVIIPALIIMIMTIGWFLAFIKFVVSGGYSSQIDMVKRSGISFAYNNESEAFTSGTVGILYGNLITIVPKILLLVQAALLFRAFFKESTKVKRILMIIDIIVAAILTIGIIIIDHIDRGVIPLPDEQALYIYNIFKGSNSQNEEKILIIIGVIAVITFIAFLALVFTSESKYILKYGAFSALLSFVILPLLLLLVENIIPLFCTIIFALILVGMVIFILMSLFSQSGDSGNSPKKYSSSSNDNTSKKAKSETRKNYEYIDQGFLGFKVFKVHGVMYDYIIRDNGIGTGEICSLKALRSGKFHIYDKATGKEIMENQIPWRK